jgi:DnaJ-class molecular chaperone
MPINRNYKETIRQPNGGYIVYVQCPICDGIGLIKDKKTMKIRKCVGCHGNGKIKETSYP